MPNSPLEQLIAELQTDARGSLVHTVQQALVFARDHLLDATEGAGSGALDSAADQVAHAVEALQLYRERLKQIAADLESMERDLTVIQSDDAVMGEDGESGLSSV